MHRKGVYLTANTVTHKGKLKHHRGSKNNDKAANQLPNVEALVKVSREEVN